MMRLLRLWCVLAFLLPAGDALAHAMLAKAAPAVGSTVAAPPAEVVLEFTEPVEPAFSTVQVMDSHGIPVSQGSAEPVPGRKDALAVKLAALAPGTYKVVWKAVSVDTHVTRGSFTFTVGAGR